MPEYRLYVLRENKEVQKQYPNLTAPVRYGVTRFHHPRDLRGVSKENRREVVTFQLKQMSPDDVEADITLHGTENIALYLFKADKNPVIEVGEIEIPEQHHGPRSNEEEY